ncbi:hypothetical protein ACFQ7J_21890 [Streptomyces sp. NPDC056501]|uniref:hypothetical protein n=1 Tax=Streptomyces sp. NPDC056501 TaxID=3345841 RepID=UPI00369C5B4D
MECDPFPLDLIRTQTAWMDTYAELSAVDTGSTTTLRRRLLRLSVRLWWHPFWETAAGGPAARVELRERVRAGHGTGVRAA